MAHLTYILSTRWAELLLRGLCKLKLFTFPIQKIKQRHGPAGPVMDLYALRDDRGRVLTLDINRHVLDLRREILAHLLPQWQRLVFLKHYRSLTMLQAYFGISIAAQLNGPVCLVNYARWKFYDPKQKEHTPNILIIPPSQWSFILKPNFEKMMDRVVVQKKWTPPIAELYVLVKHLVRSLSGYLGKTVADYSTPPVPSPALPASLMISYAMGTIEDRRNDISFFYAIKDKMAVSRLLFYFRYQNLYPSPVEMEWFKKNHIPCFSAPTIAQQVPEIPFWQPSPGFNVQLQTFFRVFFKTATQCLLRSHGQTLWLLDRLWDMGWNVAVWKDFFNTNGVRVIVHSVPGDWNFIPSLAITEVGGISVTLERSILFDYCTYFHNSPNHVNFVTGPYSLSQIPEPSFSHHTVQVGGINVGNLPEIPWITRQREMKRLVITVFDELPNDWYFGDSVRQLYEALLELVATDAKKRFVLVIKTKKPEVLEQMEDINRQIAVLTAADQCLIPDWKVTPAAAAAHSHLVLCVPSTAAFESVMAGTPTIVFIPMKSGVSLFYTNNGLNRRIFEDRDSMMAAIRRFADGLDTSVGDCSDLQKQIDPYGDGLGAERVGNYLNQCLEYFDMGLNRDQILNKVNHSFASLWGEDKITHEFFYENQDIDRADISRSLSMSS